MSILTLHRPGASAAGPMRELERGTFGIVSKGGAALENQNRGMRGGAEPTETYVGYALVETAAHGVATEIWVLFDTYTSPHLDALGQPAHAIEIRALHPKDIHPDWADLGPGRLPDPQSFVNKVTVAALHRGRTSTVIQADVKPYSSGGGLRMRGM